MELVSQPRAALLEPQVCQTYQLLRENIQRGNYSIRRLQVSAGLFRFTPGINVGNPGVAQGI